MFNDNVCMLLWIPIRISIESTQFRINSMKNREKHFLYCYTGAGAIFFEAIPFSMVWGDSLFLYQNSKMQLNHSTQNFYLKVQICQEQFVHYKSRNWMRFEWFKYLSNISNWSCVLHCSPIIPVTGIVALIS